MKVLRILFLIAGTLAIDISTFACEVCKKQQPKVLREIAHGAGPESGFDYVWVGITAIIALVSLYYAVRWIIRPGEKERKHIKYSILNGESA